MKLMRGLGYRVNNYCLITPNNQHVPDFTGDFHVMHNQNEEISWEK